MKYGVTEESKLLIINISKEIENHHYNRLLRKENGFRAYFERNGMKNAIIKTDITETDNRSIEKVVAATFDEHADIKGIFVTNSRVGSVAEYLEKSGR